MDEKAMPVGEQIQFKMVECRGDEPPMTWITLVASTSAEYYALRKKLELFQRILQERGMRCPLCNEVMGDG